MILNPSQAEAIYSSMCALNNVGARVKASFGDLDKEAINVFEDEEGFVKVVKIRSWTQRGLEFYENQADFAKAYKLM